VSCRTRSTCETRRRSGAGVTTALLIALAAACASAGAQGPAPAAAFADDTVRLDVPDGTLVGSLMRPRTGGRPPVVFILAGSGPTTRDGNSMMSTGRNESLRQLAESLAVHGIASLRVDKRWVGASAGVRRLPFDSLSVARYADDARAWLRRLVADTAFARVYALGHSEGALMVSIAAADVPVAGVILVAGSGVPLGATLRAQLADTTRLPRAFFPVADSAIAALETGRPLPTVPPLLGALFSKPNEAYLRTLLAEDPARRVGALSMPVLVVQGTTDQQVTVADAERLAGVARRGTLAIVDGVNHVLKRVSGPMLAQFATYSAPTPPTDGAVVTPIVRFVRGR
jgi:pimeloyl-ACP methyl ester carboxylesterase